MATDLETPLRIERSASAAELAQIERARRALRNSALWFSVLGLYLPAVIALTTIGWTFSRVPGSWSQKVLVSLAQLVALLSVFTLPVMVGSSGRAVFAYRRLRRDAKRGYPMAEARGEVTWGKRERAIVATVGGERLISPLFTSFAMPPALWHHFDALTPGTYSFSLLPESRLVLGAQPIAEHATSEALSAPERVLRAAFGNDDADVEANRRGRASPRQRLRLLASSFWTLLFAALLLSLLYVFLRDTKGEPIAMLVPFGLTLYMLVVLYRIVRDTLEGRVDSAFGEVTVRIFKNSVTGSIGKNRFKLRRAQTRAFQKGRLYRVYWFRHSRVVVGVDPADTTRP